MDTKKIDRAYNQFKLQAKKLYGAGWENESKAKLVNILYDKVFDEDKLNSLDDKEKDYLQQSDRHDSNPLEDTEKKIKKVIAMRDRFLSDEPTIEINQGLIKANRKSETSNTKEAKNNIQFKK